MENEKGFELKSTGLAFEKNKQAAILGWCLRDIKFCHQCSQVVKSEWFSSPNVAKLYDAVVKMYNEFGRVPTANEVRTYRPFSQEEARTQKHLEDELVNSLKQTEVYGLDILSKEMTQWMHAVVFFQALQKAGVKYNAQKTEEAWEIIEEAVLFKAMSSFEEGANEGFSSASKNILLEEAERYEQAPKVLSYGTKFLDDSLGGIIPNDLCVIGAKTGAGKTALATSISLSNAKAGKQVYYFALEAEAYEIERRIKYGIISSDYYAQGMGENKIISYTDWRMGRLKHELGALEKNAQDRLIESTKNLNVLYRTSGIFDLQSLEKNLIRIVDKAQLVIVDHLHYIDTNEDENYAYKRTIKLIRNLVLKHGVPVIVVAHLRKAQTGRGAHSLISGIEDFHGTSDIPKIATTCIMLAPAYDHIGVNNWCWPTYISVVKSRLEGSRTRYTGLCNFNSRTNRYENNYRIGKMVNQNQEFDILQDDFIPYWSSADKS